MRKKAGWRGLFACLAITAFVLGGCGKAAGETQAVSMKEEQPGTDEAAQEAGRCLRCDHYGYGNLKGGRAAIW